MERMTVGAHLLPVEPSSTVATCSMTPPRRLLTSPSLRTLLPFILARRPKFELLIPPRINAYYRVIGERIGSTGPTGPFDLTTRRPLRRVAKNIYR